MGSCWTSCSRSTKLRRLRIGWVSGWLIRVMDLRTQPSSQVRRKVSTGTPACYHKVARCWSSEVNWACTQVGRRKSSRPDKRRLGVRRLQATALVGVHNSRASKLLRRSDRGHGAGWGQLPAFADADIVQFEQLARERAATLAQAASEFFAVKVEPTTGAVGVQADEGK